MIYGERGAVNDNWIQFGTNSSGESLYWRIIRINGDGTIRLIYNGTSISQTGNSTMISTDQPFNVTVMDSDNMHVGYKYTQNEVHGLGTDSDIKSSIDNWYENNLADEEVYLEGSNGFCGDRTSTTSSSGAPNDTGGTGTTNTYYGARYRLYTNKTPSLKCTYDSDLYTTSGSSTGNGVLKYPVGLITADEVAMAGGVYDTSNSSYYLYNEAYYWTISPFWYNNGRASVFRVSSSGNLDFNGTFGTTDTRGVRPVINLRSDVSLTGTGTTSDQFKVVQSRS